MKNPFSASESILAAMREWHEAAAQVAYLLRQQGFCAEADTFLEIADQDLAERDLLECRRCLRLVDASGGEEGECRECFERSREADEREAELEARAIFSEQLKNSKEK